MNEECDNGGKTKFLERVEFWKTKSKAFQILILGLKNNFTDKQVLEQTKKKNYKVYFKKLNREVCS